MPKEKSFLALVTFERIRDHCEILPPDAQGACGYMAVKASNIEAVEDELRTALLETHLHLLEVDEISALPEASELKRIDDHLAANIEDWEAGHSTCWGTLHIYLADGEA